jgi:tetratricopeptide (TPR) repeat protein
MSPQSKRVANAEAVRELVDSAFAARYQDLEAMLNLSSKGVALAEEKRQEIPVDLLVAAWTQYGNALRIAGRFQEAERALAHAAAQSAVDTPTRIHLLEITASLRRNTKRFETAANLLTSALEAQKSIGDSDGEARLHNLLGIVYRDWGNLAMAFRSFQNAMDLLGPDTPPDVVVSTGHNFFQTLIDAGRLEAAVAALVILEPYYRRLTSARIAAKAEWMRARLCRAMHQLVAAQLAYERAYALLSTEPRSPELAELAKEMAEI